MKIKNLEQVLPVLGFNGDVQISNNLDLTIGLRLHLPEVLSCSIEKLYMLHDTFQRVINLLPAGSFLHKQDYFLVREFSGGEQKEPLTRVSTGSLNESYLEHFKGRKYLSHECFLFVSLLNRGLLKN
ncbi:MAG: DUF3875 domain-containing protein, partial [Mangrovibacterium sp.]|nr:DUF3875 domain-containing protein [Mangrovibacterium sp.]